MCVRFIVVSFILFITCAEKKNGDSYSRSNMNFSWSDIIGGSWYRSPMKIICTPPNGSFESRFSFSAVSMKSIMSALTIDISSIIIVSSFS